MLRNKALNSSRRLRRTKDAGLQGGVLILTSLMLFMNGACLVKNWAQTGRVEEQTRERRARPEPVAAPSPANANSSENQMSDTEKEKVTNKSAISFYTALKDALKERRTTLDCDRDDPVGRRILEDYGAVFVAAHTVLPPPVCIFKNEADVVKFQSEAKSKSMVLGGTRIELQPAAMDALLEARQEAQASGLDITPRGGSEAGRRSYRDTERLWNTRFLPALSYWLSKGRLTREQVARLKSLSLTDQVREVLELEKRGIYFSKDFSKSILYSIAAPGTSQHIMMLALDVEQFQNQRVRQILARHGWFQTVKSDLPHFTYLGLREAELPARGLRSVQSGSQLFWIPNIQ